MKRRERMDVLFDILVASPEGITREECCQRAEIDRDQFFEGRRDLLEWLVETDDTVSIVVIDRPGQPSLYKLGSLIDEAKPHLASRIADLETRMRTSEHSVIPFVNATDGRTADGKRARVMRKYLTRLREDLDELLRAEQLW